MFGHFSTIRMQRLKNVMALTILSEALKKIMKRTGPRSFGCDLHWEQTGLIIRLFLYNEIHDQIAVSDFIP